MTDVISANALPWDLAAAGDAAWLIDGERRVLLKADAAYESVTVRREIGVGRGRRVAGFGVHAGPDALWVADGTRRLLKLDPRDATVIRGFDIERPLDDVAVGMGAVWAVSRASATVIRIDPDSGSVRARIPITGRPGSTAPEPVAIAVGEGAVWVGNTNTPSISRIDPRIAAVTDTIPLGVGSNPIQMTVGAGSVWVALNGDGAVARIDPDGGDVREIPLGGAPIGVAVARNKVWVSVQPRFRAGVASRARTIELPGAVDEPFCAPVEFGPAGPPQYLIVSDFPLQLQAPFFQPLQFSDAVRFVLARRGFRAGRYRIGYQSCDDSGTRGPEASTPATCRRNARAIANAPRVLGVVGPFTSSCAAVELPVLNGAPGGPLATVSGSATLVGLTHGGPGAAPGEPGVYYPTGARNFARVVAADHVQGAADAMMVKRLGVRRLYVLDDGGPYGVGIAESVRRTARRSVWRSPARGAGISETGASDGWRSRSSDPAPTDSSLAGFFRSGRHRS